MSVTLETPSTLSPARAASRPSLVVLLLRGGCWGGALFVLATVVSVLFGTNDYEVVPGAVYRCAQPTQRSLEQLTRRYGIRTVINLRGVSDPAGYYLEEARAAGSLNVSLEDISLCARRLPAPLVLRRLVEVIDRSDYPILLHCARGVDRTGMTTAIVLLLHTEATVAQARHALGFQHGHIPLGGTGQMDRFFGFYEEWLTQQGRTHSRATFRHWMLEEYCPGACRSQMCVLDSEKLQSVAIGKSNPVHVRATNTSIRTWHFRPGNNAGIHCCFIVSRPELGFLKEGKAGLFHAEVAPGESIELTLALPPLPLPGKYRLLIYMNEPLHAKFHEAGDDPLFCTVEAR